MEHNLEDKEAGWLAPANASASPFRASTLRAQISGEIASPLSKTAAIRRLRSVCFLGAIDHSSFARQAQAYLTSRLDHSLGVAALADYASRKLGISENDRQVAVAAGLLHDVGHGPLSHSLENSFEESFGINHHIASNRIISGQSHASQELRAALGKFGVKHPDVVNLIEGKSEHPLNWLFSGPINLDTIEGILRVANYGPDIKHGLSAIAIVDAAIAVVRQHDDAEFSLRVLDDFWKLKGLMYSQIVRGKIGVVSDYKCQVYFTENSEKFSENHFSWNDAQIKKEFPDLFFWLADSALYENYNKEPISFVKRTFSISHESIELQSMQNYLKNRFRQQKKQSFLMWTASDNNSEEKSFEFAGTREAEKIQSRKNDAFSCLFGTYKSS